MRKLIIACLAVSWIPIAEADAYLGPGIGLGALGVALGLVLSVALAVVAVFWYPLKRVVRKIRAKLRGGEAGASAMTVPDARNDAR